MLAGFLRAFARDESGVSSSEYALLLLVATTGLALSTFMLGMAISDSVVRTAGLFSAPAQTAAAASDSPGTPGAAAASAPSDSSAEEPAPVPGCGKDGRGHCNGQDKAKKSK